MTSTRERQQRAAARARLAREMAQRQAAAKKRRQRTIIASAAGALLLVVAGTVWAVAALTGDEPEADPPAALPTGDPADDPAATEPGECAWLPAERGNVVDVGTPPAGIEPQDATQLLTIETTAGDIAVEMDLAAAPCIAASFAHLAEADFYQGTFCHRAFGGMLQCGDPTVTDSDWDPENDGTGGPIYQFEDQNLPIGEDPPYPRGTMAMANSGPGTNGSQFFLVYEDLQLDGPNYSVVGTIVDGLDVLDAVGEAGIVGGEEVGPPNTEVIITGVTLGEPQPY